MKAAVIYQKGDLPQYVDFPEPTIQKDEEVLASVKAVSIKHFDKGKASGNHYSSSGHREGGKVIGGDGVFILDNGTRVYALGVSGTLAEKATIDKDRMVKLPAGLSDVHAAALANAVIGSAMGLRYKADIQPGDTVLINGATGFTGQVAVQIAKHYGAKRVIAMGRNQRSLQKLVGLGADETISLVQEDADILAQLKALHAASPIDVVIDYLWGHSAEMILASIKGTGSFTHQTRYVSVGSVTGDLIQLSAATLRSVDLQLNGSGLGSWSRVQVQSLFREILPEMFQLAADGRLVVHTTEVKLQDIAELWDLEVPDGQRLVVIV